MKRLMIMRHGKADDTSYDYKRKLTSKGIYDVERVAEMLNAEEIYPDLIIASSAARTLQTAQIMHKVLNTKCAIEARDELYLCSAERAASVLYEINDEINTLLIIAHNPCVQEFYTDLTGEYTNYPTSALAIIDYLSDSWVQVGIMRPLSNTLIILN